VAGSGAGPTAGVIVPCVFLFGEGVVVVFEKITIVFGSVPCLLLGYLLHLQFLLDDIALGLAEQRFMDFEVVLNPFDLVQASLPLMPAHCGSVSVLLEFHMDNVARIESPLSLQHSK
jgi:hypothetical protein